MAREEAMAELSEEESEEEGEGEERGQRGVEEGRSTFLPPKTAPRRVGVLIFGAAEVPLRRYIFLIYMPTLV